MHRYKKSDGDTVIVNVPAPPKAVIVQVRSKAAFSTELKQHPAREDSTRIAVAPDDPYFRIQTRQPSAQKLQKAIIVKPGAVSTQERSVSKQQFYTTKKSIGTLKDKRVLSNNAKTEYSYEKNSSVDKIEDIQQQSMILHDKTMMTKSVLGSSSMNCGSEDVSPQITRLPTASKLVCKQMNTLNLKKDECKPIKLDYLLANIENIPPQAIYEVSQDLNAPSGPIVNYFKSSWRKKNNLISGGDRSPSMTQDYQIPKYIRYIDSYEQQLIQNYQDHDRQIEADPSFQYCYRVHEEISENLRARLVDWILHCTQVCQMEDQNIFFIVMRLVDFYYRKQKIPQPKQELQLTAIASIFMASKLLQINHVNLQFCQANIGHKKFTQKEIIKRESQILELANWEISTYPTIFEVFELLVMMIKRRVQGKVFEVETEMFLKECYSVGLNIIRAHMCILDSIRMKSLDVAPACLQIALAFTCLQVQSKKHSFIQLTSSQSALDLQQPPRHKHSLTEQQPPSLYHHHAYQAEIQILVQSWRDVVNEKLFHTKRNPFMMITILTELLRLRELMQIYPSQQQPHLLEEGNTGGQHVSSKEEGGASNSNPGNTRLKEILGVFSETFFEWCDKYVRMHERSGGARNNPIGPIMMFQTEDEEEDIYGDEEEDEVHGL